MGKQAIMGMRFLRWLALALAALAGCYALAQPARDTAPSAAVPRAPAAGLRASDEEIAAFFDRYMAAKIRDLEIPGGAMVVVRDGRTILARGYGFADLASKRPVDVEDSVFRAASISKVLPWLLTMQLVEEGRLDLDRDVNAYLDFAIPEAFGAPITMRQLMTHSAGFPEHFHGVFDPDLETPLGDKLRDNIPARVYPPGKTIAYSNYGAALAGYIVQRLRGRPWDRLVADRIFTPLGMIRSTVAQPVPASLLPSLVSTYSYGDPRPGPFRTSSLPPMASLSASAGDMGRLLAMLAGGGQGANGRILKPETLGRMMTLQKPLGPGLRDGMGLGFLVGEYRGVRYAGHAGNMTTLATDMEILPEHGLGWYYVFNSQGPGEDARKVREELLLAAIAKLAAPPAAAVPARGPSSARDVEGSYISTRRIHRGPLMFSGLVNTTSAAARPDGSLTIESSGRATHWLPAGPDRFLEEETGIPLAVTRGRDGRVEEIASALLYPVAQFQRSPAWIPWMLGLFAFSVGVLLLAVPAAPFFRAARRRRARALAGTVPTVSPRGAGLSKWARRSFWAIVATLVAWGGFGLMLAIDFAKLFALPAAVPALLGGLTMLSAVFAAIILYDAILAWRDPVRGWISRVWGMLVAAAAIGLASSFYVFDVTNMTIRW
jgi:CubicO group peptidase (beta-lactamase class C family)